MSFRNLVFVGFLLGLGLVLGDASADNEYEFRNDIPENGENDIDPEETATLSVEIENFLTQTHDFEVSISNSGDLDEKGLKTWWSHDGTSELNSESDTIGSISVNGESTENGITISIEAAKNALYGEHIIELICKDKDNSDPDGTKQTLELKINVREKRAVSLEIVEGVDKLPDGISDYDGMGSIDINNKTSYKIKINNDGNRDDVFSISFDNQWNFELSDDSISLLPFTSKTIFLNLTTDNSVDYEDIDEGIITVSSTNEASVTESLDIKTQVRVKYGISTSAVNTLKECVLGDQVTFNFNLMNKWSESINYYIDEKMMYKNSKEYVVTNWNLQPGSETPILDSFKSTNSASVVISVPSQATANEVVTIVLEIYASASQGSSPGEKVEIEIQVRVKGDYKLEIDLPFGNELTVPSEAIFTTSKYIILNNEATASDSVTISHEFTLGGSEWIVTMPNPNPFVITAGSSKELAIQVRAPQSAAGELSAMKVLVESGNDAYVYDEVTINFRVEGTATIEGAETEKLAEENEFPIDPIYLVSIVLIIGLGSTAVFGLQQKSKGAFGGADDNSQDYSDEWEGMEGANTTPQQAPPPTPQQAPPPTPQQAPPPTPQPVAAPAPTILTVAVPDGVVAGQQIQIKAPNGQLVNVKVPEGCGPGSQFKIQI